MSTVVQANSQGSRSEKMAVHQQTVYLGLACVSLCIFAIALAVKFPSIPQALALLS
jgi:hypothetical protein